MAAIERIVKDAAAMIDPQLVVVVAGSYRRGRETCGDVDVLVTHPDGKSHEGSMRAMVAAMDASGFLTHHLTTPDPDSDKYMGICQLPADHPEAHLYPRLHRRLDIKVGCVCVRDGWGGWVRRA